MAATTRFLKNIALKAADTAPGGFLSLDMNNQLIPNVADAVSAQDAVNLQTLESYTPYGNVIRVSQALSAGSINTLIGDATESIYLGWLVTGGGTQGQFQLYGDTAVPYNANIPLWGFALTQAGGFRPVVKQVAIAAPSAFSQTIWRGTPYDLMLLEGDTQIVSLTVHTQGAGNPIYKITANAQLFIDPTSSALWVDIEATLKLLS